MINPLFPTPYSSSTSKYIPSVYFDSFTHQHHFSFFVIPKLPRPRLSLPPSSATWALPPSLLQHHHISTANDDNHHVQLHLRASRLLRFSRPASVASSIRCTILTFLQRELSCQHHYHLVQSWCPKYIETEKRCPPTIVCKQYQYVCLPTCFLLLLHSQY